MLAGITVRLMAASMGKKLRPGLSTVLSMLDVGSDMATMLIYFLSDGNSAYDAAALVH